MYETYYDKLPPYFGQENIQLHYTDTDAFVLSVNTKDIIKDIKNLEDFFDFSNLDENHELFSEKNQKKCFFFRIETPKSIWIDAFVCLRSKNCSFKCGEHSKNKLKGISKSQSEHIELEENYNCLFDGKFKKESNIYTLCSNNHEMHLQEIKKSTLSLFDDKRCYINETESMP